MPRLLRYREGCVCVPQVIQVANPPQLGHGQRHHRVLKRSERSQGIAHSWPSMRRCGHESTITMGSFVSQENLNVSRKCTHVILWAEVTATRTNTAECLP